MEISILYKFLFEFQHSNKILIRIRKANGLGYYLNHNSKKSYRQLLKSGEKINLLQKLCHCGHFLFTFLCRISPPHKEKTVFFLESIYLVQIKSYKV